MKIYAYGIINSSDQLDKPIYGLEGARVYNIPYGDLGVVVSDINEPIRETTNDILEHEGVVEKLMTNYTVLPVRFRTVLNGEKPLLSMAQYYYRDFEDNLNRLRDKVEFGIKIIWPAEKIKESILNDCEEIIQESFILDDSPGKRFMRRNMINYKLDREFGKKADRFIKDIDTIIASLVAEKKLEKLKTEHLLLEANYLVEKDKQKEFIEVFDHVKSSFNGFWFLFSGPWPPYNFVILTRNFPLSKSARCADMPDAVFT